MVTKINIILFKTVSFQLRLFTIQSWCSNIILLTIRQNIEKLVNNTHMIPSISN